MRLHLVAFPHTRVSREFSGCAYTSKLLKFGKMTEQRHEVVLYAPAGSDASHFAEHVDVLSEAERVGIFGPDDPNRLPAWPADEQCELMNGRAIAALHESLRPDDLILLPMGWSQRAIAQAFPDALCVEPGVGYFGVLDGWRAFESYAWMHTVYARQGEEDGRWYDTVIPNYFDRDDFPYRNDGSGDYLLFVGRIIHRKGPQIAAELADALGMKLVVAGAGASEWRNGAHGFIRAPEVGFNADDLEYVGPVTIEQRAELMAGAACLVAPTTYIEPFGGVTVEAMLCGTPVVTTDWGAFPEIVWQGISGYRFRTLAAGCMAVEQALQLDRDGIRAYAEGRYSLEAVAPQFDAWFERLDGLRRQGWYEPRKALA